MKNGLRGALAALVLTACNHDFGFLDDAFGGRGDAADARTDTMPVCATGTMACNGRCISFVSDPANCGACGRACSSTQSCAQGTCAATCPGTQVLCNGACTDTQADSTHCGSCVTGCRAGESCSIGRCTPPATVDARVDAHTDAADVTLAGNDGGTIDAATPDASTSPDVLTDAARETTAGTGALFCASGTETIGAVVPDGFCVHTFASITAPRTLVVAPDGDLFVALPGGFTPGGAGGGMSAIVVLSDDDHDGVAESHTYYQGPLPATPDGGPAETMATVHGLAIRGGALYFTTERAVWRMPYVRGQRAAATQPVRAATFETVADQRWTHGVSVSSSGTVYATQGVYSASFCPDTPRNGSIRRMGATGSLDVVSEGFRNPMYVRCHATDDVCLVSELGDDGGASYGARERLVSMHGGTNYGFPCCATVNVTSPYARTGDGGSGGYNCADVPREEAAFAINDTPFGLDWETGAWPAPFTNALFVAKHGSFYSSPAWQGASIVYAATDAITHLPSSAFQPFLTGFGPGGASLERPADVAFSPDGRMFVADDQGGQIYWIAPRTLRRP